MVLAPLNIVSRGDWLGKPANIEVDNNGAVVYIGSSLTMHDPLFFIYKLWLNKLMVGKFKMIGMLLKVVHSQVQKS